jgi:hypothetical protein
MLLTDDDSPFDRSTQEMAPCRVVVLTQLLVVCGAGAAGLAAAQPLAGQLRLMRCGARQVAGSVRRELAA